MTLGEPSELRSRTMRAVKSKDTTPELLIRRLLRGQGYRFQLHRTDLPGCPDLVFMRRKKVIFIHGCFWHGHDCPRGARVPKTNRDYWMAKVARNQTRDRKNRKLLRADGWGVLAIWECKTKSEKTLSTRLNKFLEG